jgi:death-on-curing protein
VSEPVWLTSDVIVEANLAVALLAGIVQNHPFEQGNKRTGFAAARLFLNVNGYDIASYTDEAPALAELVIGLAEHRLDEAEIVAELRAYVVEFDPPAP